MNAKHLPIPTENLNIASTRKTEDRVAIDTRRTVVVVNPYSKFWPFFISTVEQSARVLGNHDNS